MCYQVNNLMCAGLDEEWQVTLYSIRSVGKLKRRAETYRRNLSGRLKTVLDTNSEFVTGIICQTFQSSQFPPCTFVPLAELC